MAFNNDTSLGFFAGVNYSVSEDSLQQGEVAGASNFLFRRREATTRPGLKTTAITGFTGTCVFAKSFLGIGTTPLTILISSNGKIYSLSSANVCTEITGSGTTFDSTGSYNAAMANRVILIGNNTGGLLRWDPTGTTYTIISDAPYRYVVGNTARAIAAYRLAGDPGDPITIAWSDEGDETVWTTTGDSTAGQSILVDMPGDITGLSTIHNLIVIARNNGWHTGTPSGSAFPAFLFAPWAYLGPGVFYSDTLAVHNNIAYAVGEDDVYTFDLQSISPIGTQVRDILIPLLNAGIRYSGFISRAAGNKPRFTYHLAPCGTPNAPHFILDLTENTWSVCNYDDQNLKFGFQRYPALGGGVCFVSATPALRTWDDETSVESPAFLEAPTQFIGALSMDTRIDAILLKYRNQGDIEGVKVSVNGQLGTIDTGTAVRRKIGSGSSPGTNKWQRAWFRMGVVGQGFAARIDVDAGSRFTTNYLEFRAQEAGQFKGELL